MTIPKKLLPSSKFLPFAIKITSKKTYKARRCGFARTSTQWKDSCDFEATTFSCLTAQWTIILVVHRHYRPCVFPNSAIHLEKIASNKFCYGFLNIYSHILRDFSAFHINLFHYNVISRIHRIPNFTSFSEFQKDLLIGLRDFLLKKSLK